MFIRAVEGTLNINRASNFEKELQRIKQREKEHSTKDSKRKVWKSKSLSNLGNPKAQKRLQELSAH